MNTETLFEKAYSEIHFAEVVFERERVNPDGTHVRISGRIVGRHKGVHSGVHGEPTDIPDTITIRDGNKHTDVYTHQWELVDYKECDDVEQVKQEWQA